MEFHEYRIHEDNRRRGAYDVVPGLPGDVNFTKHEPGIIPQELHMHEKQTDYFAVAKGRVMFRLVHEGVQEEKFILTENDHKTLVIPPGVWHGYMALEPSIMVFYLSHKFDQKDEFRRKTDPSEWKLPEG